MDALGRRLATAALLAAPSTAVACPVCVGAGSERVIAALYWSTVVLSLLPLAMVGALVLWLTRRARAVALEADAPAPERSATATG
jgi:hypothetical protein